VVRNTRHIEGGRNAQVQAPCIDRKWVEWYDVGTMFERICSLFARVFLVFVFAVAGTGKLLDATRPAAAWGPVVGVSLGVAHLFFRLLGALEISVALGLLVRRGKLNLCAAIAATGMSLVFVVVTFLRLTGYIPVASCGCFGLMTLGPRGGAELIRELLLMASSLLVVLESPVLRHERRGHSASENTSRH
jgi:hypothetical protein